MKGSLMVVTPLVVFANSVMLWLWGTVSAIERLEIPIWCRTSVQKLKHKEMHGFSFSSSIERNSIYGGCYHLYLFTISNSAAFTSFGLVAFR